MTTRYFTLITSVAMMAALLSSCQNSQHLAQPGDLRNAILNAVDSIAEAAKDRDGKPKVGLYPAEAKITFNVTATHANETSLGASGGYQGVTLKVDNKRTRSNTQGNTIEITLKSVNTLDPTKPTPPILFNVMDPAALQRQINDALKVQMERLDANPR